MLATSSTTIAQIHKASFVFFAFIVFPFLSQNFAFHFNITGQKFPLQRCAPKGHTTASFAAVNSSNKTVRTDTWSYDSNGHLAGWTNSGNSNGYSNVLRLSSDNNIGAGNPLFDRHCGKFVTDDKITSASIKFQNDEVVEIRQNNQRISYTNQESMGMNSSNNLTRTFATYTDGGNFRYRTLVEYFKYKN